MPQLTESERQFWEWEIETHLQNEITRIEMRGELLVAINKYIEGKQVIKQVAK